MRKSIVVRFTFEGVHKWPDAQNYLKHPHRHVFHVEAVKDVRHNERDIEFINYKHTLQRFCDQKFGAFEHNWSCETMAEHLVEMFKLRSCRIFEDNENGAEVSVE